RTFSVASRMRSTGKVAGDGRPPAKEMTSGRSVTLRISRIAELVRARARPDSVNWVVMEPSLPGCMGRPNDAPQRGTAATGSSRRTVACLDPEGYVPRCEHTGGRHVVPPVPRHRQRWQFLRDHRVPR